MSARPWSLRGFRKPPLQLLVPVGILGLGCVTLISTSDFLWFSVPCVCVTNFPQSFFFMRTLVIGFRAEVQEYHISRSFASAKHHPPTFFSNKVTFTGFRSYDMDMFFFFGATIQLPCLPRWLSGKECSCQCSRQRRHGFYPWVWKILGGGKGNPLQYSCLENPMAEEPGKLQSSCKESDMTEQLSTFNLLHLYSTISQHKI